MIRAEVDVASWLRAWRDMERKTLVAAEEVFYKVGNTLYMKIKDYTPVGNPALWSYPAPPNYAPGRLKGAWVIEFSKDEIRISNPMDYALRVEYGWSSQAPNGMMRRACGEFTGIVNKITREVRR